MLEKIMTFLQSLVPEDEGHTRLAPDDIRVATIGLCFQIMAADGEITESERNVVIDAMRAQYSLDDTELKMLLEAGENAEKEAVDHYRFTSILNRRLDADQKVALVGLLWDIAYADGIRHEIEEHAIWRVAELLGVETRDRVEARQDAERRSNTPSDK